MKERLKNRKLCEKQEGLHELDRHHLKVPSIDTFLFKQNLIENALNITTVEKSLQKNCTQVFRRLTLTLAAAHHHS